MKAAIVLSLLTLSSCQKNFQIISADSIEEMICTTNENCQSSADHNNTLQSFKFLAESEQENIEMIKSASKKYNVKIIEQRDNYIHLSLDQIHLEFYADSLSKTILVKSQLAQKSMIGTQNPNKLTEKIRFDFFQKNY